MRWMLMFICVLSAPCFGFMAPDVRVSVAVVDEFSNPVEGAEVIGTFLGVTDFDEEHFLTDSDGRALVSGRSYFPVGIAVRKRDFYWSATKVNTKEVINGKEHYLDRKVTIVLKGKRNPIPLYAKRYTGEIPVAEEWVGFDLEAGDWVAPYGRGASTDFQFWFQGKLESINSGYGELKLKFSDDDGIVDITDVSKESELKVPHSAPKHGYLQKEIVWRAAIRKNVEGRPDRNRFHFLRVRTTVDEQGKVEVANYAKMYGDVFFSLIGRQGGVSRIQFQYYFNPIPNDPNLEFDTNRNLFRNLPHDEQVREP